MNDLKQGLMTRHKAHSKEISAIYYFSEDLLLTGSADRSVRLWKGHKTISVFSDPKIPNEIVNLCY